MPYVYSHAPQGVDDDYKHVLTSRFPNTKKIFDDTSRFLSATRPHQLAFMSRMKDIYYWSQVMESPEYREIINGKGDLLEAFRVKFDGTSLFHNFADDREVIQSVFRKYQTALENGMPSDDPARLVPLYLLSPDDKHHMTALDAALLREKPANFELMVGMLKDFSDICSSKMMLNNFETMLRFDNGQTLDFLNTAQFKPPLLQSPFVIKWPDVEEVIFTSNTSLVTLQQVKSEVRAFARRHRALIPYNDPGSPKDFDESKETNRDPLKKIVVQALDFDWVFDKDNTLNFLKLLDTAAADKAYD
jgi:hypothetical protein